LNGSVAGVLVALTVALAAIGLFTAKDEAATKESPGGEPAPRNLSVERVARRVERIRELRFDRLPRVRRVSAAQARAAALGEYDRYAPRSEQEAAERLLKLLGLLADDASLRETLARATASEVGGYYVPRTDTLALVRGAGLDGLLGEVALAHELVHALEDQRFGLEPGRGSLWSDRDTARSGLTEGSATLAMVDYIAKAQGSELPAGLRERALEQLGELAIPAGGGLPRYVRESLVFPYAAGATLVNRIQGDGGWDAVDAAYAGRPVLSSEQLMHPEKYENAEAPVAVRLPDYRKLLPAGTTQLTGGDLGEFDTEQFLREGNGRERSERAAAGWGGSAFELWELPDGGELLVAAWAWDTSRDAREFAEAATRRLSELNAPGAIRGGPRRRVVLALAPKEALARRIAASVP